MDSETYQGREQTLVKHFILRQYLSRFAHIVGWRWRTLTYVDCFSGPWNVRSGDLSDSSFAIALEELRKAQATLTAAGRRVALRCFFLEKDRSAFLRLKAFADDVRDATIQTKNATLEASVPSIVEFILAGGVQSFPFIFIDPTGWTGFSMGTITPLLKLNPGEVLVNFMTGFIKRFIEAPQDQTRESFERLFGSGDFRERLQGLAREDRESAAVEAYAENVRRVGGFSHTCSAIVLHPEINRTHFHLIFATRSRKGVQVFKEAEKKAMALQENARAEARGRRREAETGQRSFLSHQELYDPAYYNFLRQKCLAESQRIVADVLRARGRVSYDKVWETALSRPLTWESDLKGWIREWQDEGLVSMEGLAPRQRVPHLDQNQFLVWKEQLAT